MSSGDSDTDQSTKSSTKPQLSFSSLYVTGRYAKEMAKVAKPDYHKKFLTRLIDTINDGSLKKGLERRLGCTNLDQEMLYKYFSFSDACPSLEALPAYLNVSLVFHDCILCVLMNFLVI